MKNYFMTSEPTVALSNIIANNTSETKTFTSKKSIRCSKIFIKFMFAVFVLGFVATSCKEKAIEPKNTDPPFAEPCNTCIGDYSKLYEQPLEVIQCCVIGEWQIIRYGGGAVGMLTLSNTFAKITKDSVIITTDEFEGDVIYGAIPPPTTYRWEKKEVSSLVGSTYVMILDEPTLHFGQLEWIFDRIQNDTLRGDWLNSFYGFWFLRIKNDEVTE